jgi:hypothetical protein
LASKNSKSKKGLSSQLKEMAALPRLEWDFRWVADEHEAEHVGTYEAAREVVRVSAARAGCAIPDVMGKLALAMAKHAGRILERKDIDWVVGVFMYLSFSQLSVGRFPGPAIASIDPSLELIDAMRKLRAVVVQPGSGSRFEIPSSNLLFQVEPGVSLQEAVDALEFQFKMQRFELKEKPPVRGRPGMPILRALSFYRYSMGRQATNLHLDFEQELDTASTFKPGRPLTAFGEQLYRGIQGSNTNDPINVWSTELARFEDYFEAAVRQMVSLIKARS